MTIPPPPNGSQPNPYDSPRNQWGDGNAPPNPPPSQYGTQPQPPPPPPDEEAPPEEKAPTGEGVPAESKSALRKADLHDQPTSEYGA